MLAVGAGIGGVLYMQHSRVHQEESPMEPALEAVKPVVVNVVAPVTPKVETVVPEPTVEVPVEIPTPDRYAMQILESSDGHVIEAQVLDVADGVVFIRREDKKVFEVRVERFAAESMQLVSKWQSAYGDLVTPEQKAFLRKPVAAVETQATPDPEREIEKSQRGEPIPDGPYIKGSKPRVEWSIVENMSDEFEGRKIDTDKWQIEPKGNGWNWIGRPPGLFRSENVGLGDGKLQVTVSKLKKPLEINGNEFLYQGAIVRSIHAGQPGWFYECKMKANATEMSSTFWLMTKGNTVKKLELDIQECVGVVSDNADAWVDGWDAMYHSNMIHRTNKHNSEHVQRQGSKKLKRKNSSRYYVYGAWWKSPTEVLFYLDGEHVYTINPSIEFDVPSYLQMAIETYDWNPVPEKRSMIERGTLEQRMTQYEWVRTWKVEE